MHCSQLTTEHLCAACHISPLLPPYVATMGAATVLVMEEATFPSFCLYFLTNSQMSSGEVKLIEISRGYIVLV